MNSAEYSVWVDEYSRNPWGEQRDLIHAAYNAYVTANYAGKSRKDALSFEDAVASMNASIYQLMHPDEATEIGPDDIFSKSGD